MIETNHAFAELGGLLKERFGILLTSDQCKSLVEEARGMTIRWQADEHALVRLARERLEYDASTGLFRWIIRKRGALAGWFAGATGTKRARWIKIDGVQHQAHRLAWAIANGAVPAVIEHIDGDRGNNRLENLRPRFRHSTRASKSMADLTVDGLRLKEADFWRRVDDSGGPDECWPWTGALTVRGYGRFSYANSLHPSAHRVAFALSNGFFPEAVCHACDNRRCCNPNHLFGGTATLNNSDRDEKGRQAKGTDFPMAKITDDQARAIVAEYEAGGISQRSLASRYGVSHTTVGAVVRGELWKHATQQRWQVYGPGSGGQSDKEVA